ncbi:type II toxin-antitoxin system PrlF family antitoxin [Pseudomonas sp. 11/12A]|uniref:type II toxin-antitoxin system PrlF family antitoxin n=1 Tax=Pseudomonas sp. 11/12A TaxID=1506582 RepID=UPI00068EE771|nr:type II toxin-antitoxin system PrlF family antitoxin [Pseudomonas sp. 11/12A]
MKDSRTLIKGTDDGLHSLAEKAGDDHSVSLVLQRLAADIEHNPEKLRAVDAQLVARIQSLVLGVDADLDAPLLSVDD